MEVTATEFKNNLGRYLELSQHEDIFIKRNGRVVSRLTVPYEDRRGVVESLVGILSADYDAEATLASRRARM